MFGFLIKNDALLFMAAIAENFPELHVPILSFSFLSWFVWTLNFESSLFGIEALMMG